MKRITFLLLLTMFSHKVMAQVLNQPAGWPNTDWDVTGTFVDTPDTFEADPRVTANFAYDDDDAGSGSTNTIAAESPVIDLTDAHNAGETWLFMTATYVYNHIGNDRIYIQYWDADASSWVNWGTPLSADTPGAPLNNFCSGTSAPFNSGELNIGVFTATQLSGFRYRILFDDGGSWVWGFCFDSPTIFSEAPPTCAAPTGLAVSNVGGSTATITWLAGNTETAWEYVRQAAGTGEPTGNGTQVTSTTFNETTLESTTAYEVYVRADCGVDGYSPWVGPLTFTTTIQTEFSVDCIEGPRNFSNYCYGNGGATNPEIFTFTSTDGTSLNLTFNAGQVENNWDELVIIDTDGSYIVAPTDNFYGNSGNLSGLTYQSSGDTISFYINSDGSISCQSQGYTPIDVTVACATCVNPTATYSVRSDCAIGAQFYVDVDITSIGSATTLTLTDNQGGSPQSVTTTGMVSFGPYPTATNVQITVSNDDDPNCQISSNMLTLPFCQDFTVDCAVGPVSLEYCYDSGGATNPVIFTFTSTDGTPLNLTFNAGQVENNWDELVIVDTDGSYIVAPTDNFYGNSGNLSGLTYQSSGDTISFYINSDGSVSCQSQGYTPIDVTVACATCVNPVATYSVRSDCAVGSQFYVDVDITNIGSATTLTLTDNQGSSPQSVTSTGMVSFGPYPTATDVQITVSNDDDLNCQILSNMLTLPFCQDFIVDCAVGPASLEYCYDSGGATNPVIFTFTSTDGTPLNLTFNAGQVENNWDELVIIDTDGSYIVAPTDNFYGNNGDLTGLTYQSTGDTISFYINSDGIVSCQQTGTYTPIDVTVACATCINPAATYAVIDDCENGEQFLIEVNITSIGDAQSVTVTDNQASPGQQVTETGVVQMGPYPFATPIVITISNDQDVNCSISSPSIQVAACPPTNDNPCGATVAIVNNSTMCDQTTSGTILAATPSGVPNGSCVGNPDDDVWFQFTALDETQVISLLNITGGTTNLDHALYSGSCGTLTEMYCSGDSSAVTPILTVGDTYFIRVFSAGSTPETSNFELCIQSAPNNVACEDAANFCSDGSGSNIVGFPDNTQVACLGSIPNPAWNIIQIGDPGLIQIEISQYSNTGQGLDVDFVLWGPFDINFDYCSLDLLVDCPSCPNNTWNPDFYPFGNIVDCSYDPAYIEHLTIHNAQSGEIYLLLVTNYSNSPGTITITQTNQGQTGAGSTVAEIQVDLGGDQQLCGYTSYEITANSPFADAYEWYQDGFIIDNATSSTLTVTESGVYSVFVYDQQCGSTATDEVTITLVPEPVANAVSDIVTCDDASGDGVGEFNLDAQTPLVLGGQDPSLFNVSYHLTQIDANTDSNPLASPYTNISNPQTIYVRVEAVGGEFCIATTNFQLVISGPTPTVTHVDYSVCDESISGGTASFDLESQTELVIGTQDPEEFTVTYHLTEEEANSGTGMLASPYTNTSNPQTIWVRIESNVSSTCFGVGNITLNVGELPVTTLTSGTGRFEICNNATRPLTITASGNYTSSDVSVVWYHDGGVMNGENGLSISVLDGGLYEVEVTFNETGCTSTVGQQVVVLENCIIPQGISPNGDGKNDTFDLSGFNVTKIEIYNRYGTLVYSKDNYTDEWHGQSNNGDELPVGTYFYTIVYEGGAKTKSAWVYLNK